MANMTATTMATWLQEQWSALASITYQSNVVLPNLMDRRWEPEIGVHQGDTIRIPVFSQNTGAVKRSTFGTAASLTLNNTQESQVTLLIDNMAYYGYGMPVEMEAQTFTQYMQHLDEGIGQAVALKIDNELASDNANGLDAFQAIGTDNVDITEDTLFTAETNLGDQNAPLADRYLVVSPASRASLLKIESLRNSLYGATIGNLDSSKGRGFLGRAFTYEIYESNNLDEDGISGKKNAMFHMEAIAFAEQKSLTVVNDLNIEDGLINQVVGYNIYGFKLIKSGFGREIAGK